MSKAVSKAQRRQRKRTITLHGSAPVPQPATQGARHDLTPQDPADLVALKARARITGCTVEQARDVLAADDMGRCIRALYSGTQRRADMLNTWQAVSASWHNFATKVLNTTPTPQAASLASMPDPMQTDPSLRVDLRTTDERADAARASWNAWRAAFNKLQAGEALMISSAVRGFGARLWDADQCAPTKHGIIAVAALGKLHEMRNG